jgi:hypothetical protein
MVRMTNLSVSYIMVVKSSMAMDIRKACILLYYNFCKMPKTNVVVVRKFTDVSTAEVRLCI